MAEGVERKLAAILAADVVGYSRLMAADEEGTLTRLQALRVELVDPIIAKHHGRIVKLMGDGTLVEFASVVDAVRCAVDLQRDMAERDLDLPEDRRIRFRIGVNLGDVIIEGDDIYGDGVNIASRLEGLAEPGGIIISGTAFDHAKKAEAGFKYIGRRDVKNIPEPVRAYEVLLDPAAVGSVIEDEIAAAPARWRWPAIAAAIVLGFIAIGTLAWLRPWESAAPEVSDLAKLDTRRIAVLPFTNISVSKEDTYFADGMTEELISQLSKITELSVIARSSVLKYRDTEQGADEIGRELDVGTILEGSVRKAGDEVRITAQLIDVASQSHLWSENYDRPFEGIFAIQSEIAQQVADALQIRLLADERIQVENLGTNNAEAYNLYLRGIYFYSQDNKEGVRKAKPLFELAIEHDPNFAKAYAKLADLYGRMEYHDEMSLEELRMMQRAAVDKALALDDSLAEAHAALASLKLESEWDWDGAERSFRKAIALNPSYFRPHKSLGHMLLSVVRRQHDEGIAELKRAVQLNPWSANVQDGLGWGYYHAERYEEALAQFRKVEEMFPNAPFVYVGLCQALAMQGMTDEGVVEMEKGAAIAPDHAWISGFLAWAYGVAGRLDDARIVIEKLEARAKEGSIPSMPMAWAYAGIGDKEQALDWLEEAYQKRDTGVIFMQSPEFRKALKDEPRFQELRRKLKLGPEGSS